jgi:Zn-dependent protease/CBS domain-containing protein
VFGRRIRLTTILGFPVELDWSWFIVAVLASTSLSGRFADRWPDLSTVTHWSMGVVVTLGLFGSILLHELGHAVAARHFQMRIRRIVLFIFGGVAEMADEPPSPRAEFFVALAGPAVSLILGGLCVAAWLALGTAGWPIAIVAVLGHLSFVNFAVVAFNMLPALPLDGGRVLRSILWGLRDLAWATRICSALGSLFGFGLMGLGAWWILQGQLIGGIWYVLIGLFLHGAARASYRQLVLRSVLSGTALTRIMTTDPITVAPELSLTRLVEDVVLSHPHAIYPVVAQGRLFGWISTEQVRGTPRESWAARSVGDLAAPPTAENTIDQGADALAALLRMHQTGHGQLMVVDGSRLLGIVSLRDLLELLSAAGVPGAAPPRAAGAD